MRNLSVLFGVLLVMGGVFGADEVKDISANVGEDVVVHTDDTDADAEAEVKRADELLWRIRGEKGFIARLDREANTVSMNTDDKRFSGRVQMNEKTGSLTIKNINTADSRVYELQISSRSGIKTKTFSLTVDTDVVIVEVSVMEGDSVTLNIDSTKQKDEKLIWTVKPKDETVYKSIKNERFKTGETGSLTITNINIKDGGLYRLESSSDIKSKARFNVAVHDVFSDEKDGVKTVSEKTGNSVLLHTHVTEIEKNDPIEWTFGPQNISIAKTDGKSKFIFYNYSDVRFNNRLTLQTDSGDLTIKNANSEHSGLYQIKIITNTFTIQKRFSVTVSDVVIVEVSVMEGDSVTLNIDSTKQKDEELNWKVKPKDENVYKSINDERFKTGETGSLTITNINIKDGGLYRLESSSSTSSGVKYKARLNVAVHDSGLSSGAAAGIVFSLMSLLVVAVVIYYHRKISKLHLVSCSFSKDTQDQDIMWGITSNSTES